MAKRLPVQGLTEGAILAGLVALLALVTLYVPPLLPLSILITPLPLTVLIIRHGIRLGLLAALVAAVIGVLIAGPVLGVFIVVTFAPLGISTGIAARRGLSAPLIVLIAGATVVLAQFLNLMISVIVAGVNPITAMFAQMAQSEKWAEQFYSWVGLSPQQIAEAALRYKESLAFTERAIVGLMIAGGFLLAWGYYAFGRRVLRRVQIVLPALPPMTTWRVPPAFVWLYMLGYALVVVTIAPGLHPIIPTQAGTVGLNLLTVTQYLFMLQGGIVGWMLMEKYAMLRWLRWAVLIMVFLNPILASIVFLLGVADTAFGLRRRWAQPAEPGLQGDSR